jgi:hypothetical protein
MTNFLEGFLYSVQIYSYALTSFMDKIGFKVCTMCDVCPVKVCLGHCAWNEFLDEDATC